MHNLVIKLCEALAHTTNTIAYFEALKTIKHPTIRRFAVLSGARRVGKTTMLYQMIETLMGEGISPKNILYVSIHRQLGTLDESYL